MPTPSALHLERAGTGTKAVLLHSSGLSGRQWRRLVPGVTAQGLCAIVPDFTGHGESAPWPDPTPFSFRRDLDLVVDLLAAEGPAHVVGHSYGALVALLAALAAPQSVRSLVLFEPVAFGSLNPVRDKDARAELVDADFRWGPSSEDRERWLKTFVDFWGGSGAWGLLREEARAEFRRVGWVVHRGVQSLVEDTTPASAYGVVRVPVQLISGERSPLPARRVVQRLGEAIPNARVETIAKVGHMAPLTHGEAVNEIILTALTRAESTLAPAGS